MRFSSPAITIAIALGTTVHLPTTDAVNFIVIQPDDMDFYESWSPPPHFPWPRKYPGKEFPGLSTLPNINRLRENGLEMTQAYTASPKCGTSRYSTVTGRYASRSSYGRLAALGESGPSDASIPNTKLMDVVDVADGDDCTVGNIAQVFSKNGYKTGIVGKWHLTRNKQAGNTVEGIKQEVIRCGFQEADAMYPDNMDTARLDGWYNGDYSHNMEYVAFKAVEFIEESTNDDWFLYVNPTMPHSPDVLEAMSHPCLKTPDGDFTGIEPHDWSVIGMTAEFGNDCMAYREDVKRRAENTDNGSLGGVWIDDAVGAILNSLERTNQLDNTLILFQLDHGKVGKDQIWEGGIRIPQFIHYPRGLGMNPRQFNGLVSTIDIGPTLLDFAGLDESSFGWYDMDGKSWKDAIGSLDLEDSWTNRCLFFESSRERAVRCGCSKFIQLQDSSSEKEEAVAAGWWKDNEVMFNLCDDQGDYIVADPTTQSSEMMNILSTDVDLANELQRALQCHLQKTDADFDPVYTECSLDSTHQPPPSTTETPPTPETTTESTLTTVTTTSAPPAQEIEILASYPHPGHYTSASSAIFQVSVTDSPSVKNVKFQLSDPSGSRSDPVNGFLGHVENGAMLWSSPELSFDVDGNWKWRATVIDFDGNKIATEWFDIVVSSNGASSVISMIRDEIGALIDVNQALSPKFLRLGFHDCVGGCDGCVDLNDGDNNGLDVPINALAPIVQKYAHNSELGIAISRADIWALATLVGVDKATPGGDRPADVTFPMSFIGRQDCDDADESGVGGPPRSLPSPDLTTHELLDFFEQEFDFDVTETVVIMGAHTLGSARISNSGFNGEDGWVFNPRQFNNGYYDMLVGGSVDPDNFNDLVHAPAWDQEFIDNDNSPTPSRYQWFHQKQINDPDDTRADQKLIMTNADIALVRDLADHMVSDDNGVPGHVPTCKFRCRGTERLTGCPDSDPPLCPVAETMMQAAEYKMDNGLFLSDFQEALDKMLLNGYATSDLEALIE